MKSKATQKTDTLPRNFLEGRGALKLKAASRYLSVNPITIRRLVERNLLHANRGMRHLLFSISELDRFLHS
jgi:hypothetical protein